VARVDPKSKSTSDVDRTTPRLVWQEGRRAVGKDGANRAIFISIDQGATRAPNWSLMGRPAFPTEKRPGLASKGDVERVDGQPWLSGSVTLQGSTTVSPFVVLN
jgi:hypothetical protein